MMLGPLFLIIAAAGADFGTSPFVQADHAHRWTLAQDDAEVIGWIDEAWRSETMIDGVRYPQVLIRTEVKGDDPAVADAIAAVDCKAERLKMQRLWVIQSSGGTTMELPLDDEGWQNATTDPNQGDDTILDIACGKGRTRR